MFIKEAYRQTKDHGAEFMLVQWEGGTFLFVCVARVTEVAAAVSRTTFDGQCLPWGIGGKDAS